MAYSQADLDNVRSAIAKGELSVEFADRKVVYRSIDELLKAEERIATAISTSTPRSKQSFGSSCKGFR